MQLVDTNVFIDHFRSCLTATNFFNSSDESATLFSAITEAELVSGQQCSDSGMKSKALQFMGRWRKIEVTNQIAVLAGDLAREHPIEIADAIIAATALIHKAKLVTGNLKHFSMIKNLVVRAPY